MKAKPLGLRLRRRGFVHCRRPHQHTPAVQRLGPNATDEAGYAHALDFIAATFNANVAGFPVSTQRISQGFEDWDLFQVGGVIFF